MAEIPLRAEPSSQIRYIYTYQYCPRKGKMRRIPYVLEMRSVVFNALSADMHFNYNLPTSTIAKKLVSTGKAYYYFSTMDRGISAHYAYCILVDMYANCNMWIFKTAQ